MPLLQHMAADMQRAPLPPRESEMVVVQSQGMRRWVTLALADTHGCVGSLALPFPASCMHDLAARLCRNTPSRLEQDPFSRDALAWRVDELLRTMGDDPVHAPLRNYLVGSDDRARFGLATQIAGRLDDYQLYRADLLQDWERGGRAPGTPHAAWQAALWRQLCADGSSAHGPGGARIHEAIERLNGATPDGLPTRLTVFGVSSLPPLFIELLAALARHVPVTVYSATVTASSSHPLVTEFGAQSREFLTALQSHGAVHDAVTDDVAPAAQPSLLRTLQAEFARGDDGSMPLALATDDASLRVHSAHGELRQLEIVRDQLLAAMADDATLRPHDLLLLVPDAAAWAPLVDAVFGVTEPDVPQIRYRIADRPARGEDQAADAFSMLLGLHGGRLTHSEVFELLARPLVHTALGLAETDVDALSAVTHAANTRWGYDAASREALGMPAYEEASWRASLDRLLIGIATGVHDDLLLDVLPQAGDTHGDAESIATLATWIDSLAAALDDWDTPRTPAAWSVTMQSAVQTLLSTPDTRDAQSVASVTRLLSELADLSFSASYSGDVPFGVVRDWLEAQLDLDTFGSGFLSGGMTVAALKPMRSLPFKVIAVVGLDEGVFPRRERRAAFDMLELEHRAGDRDMRTDDRQLFLDLLCAAEQRLILTYSGRAVTDNSPRASSVVIDELLDHLDRRTGGVARERIVVVHPLQPFSRRYFAPDRDARLFTYSTTQARAAIASLQVRGADVPFVTTPLAPVTSRDGTALDLTLAELADCWRNPSKFFCRQALGFTIPGGENESGDDEELMLDMMTQGLLKSRMLAVALHGDADIGHELRRLQGDGSLPPGALGSAWSECLRGDVTAALSFVPLEITARIVPVSVTGSEWRVSGMLDGVRGDTRYVVRAGSFRAEHRVRAWVEHVVMCAAHEGVDDGAVSAFPCPVRTVLVAKKGIEVTYECVPDARALLTELMVEAGRGRAAPLVFFPQAAICWLDAIAPAKAPRKNAAPKDPQAVARAQFACEANQFQPVGGDHADEHVALCFRGVDPLVTQWNEFERLTRLLFRPLLSRITA